MPGPFSIALLGYSAGQNYFAVGMMNSAPLAVLSGQRCIIDFWRV
jgi:hypothetical protein